MLWPTQGALGRKEIAGRPTAETVKQEIGSDVEEIHTLSVEPDVVHRLQQALDRIYLDGLDMAVTAYEMTFVHHRQRYTDWSN